jgi:hypothetical protein
VAIAAFPASGAGLAQTTAKTGRPETFLAAPADGVAYYGGTQRAARLIEDHKWADAEVLLDELTRAFPLDSAYTLLTSNWGRLATARRQQGKHAAAIRAYEKVIELQGPGLAYPGSSNARYWIAASHLALGNAEAALDTLELMISEDRYLARTGLFQDAAFSRLKDHPRFQTIAGKSDISSLSRTDGWRRDIDYLVSELKRSDPKSAPIPHEFFGLAQKLKASVSELSDEQIVAAIGEMLNTLERGHTALWLGASSASARMNFKPLPLRLYVFAEGIFITEARPGLSGLIGAQVLKFGNMPAVEALRRVGATASAESAMEILWLAPRMLVRPAVLKGLGTGDRADRAELTLRMPNGKTVRKTVMAGEEPASDQWRRKLNPPPGVSAPLFLSKIREAHWFQYLPDRKSIYVQVNNMTPDAEETLPQFGLRLRRAIADDEPQNVIIDLRHNNGGNSFSYVELLRTLTSFSTRAEDRVYALIGRNVYSAAGNFSTDLERLVRPVFVGEPTSATGNNWGDESPFVLPYSGITGAFSGVRWQLSHPWDQRRSIVPHVPVQLTAKAYFAGQDPALEAVFRLIESEPMTH